MFYDWNEDNDKANPFPLLEFFGVLRRNKHPFKNERNILFWENVTKFLIEEGGMVLSIMTEVELFNL